LAAIVAALAIWPAAARADIPPPPDVVQRQLADTIRQAGHECAAVTSFGNATSPDADAMVVCSNGKSFLVARPPARPNFNPPPLPAPPAIRVKPL
jgi:hypothetical protein